MVTRLILDSHPASTLKKEISKTNIKGYSKMTKKQLLDVMMANKERFSHIKKKEYVPPKRTKKAEPKKPAPKKPAPKKVMAKPKADTEPKRPSEPKRPAPKKKAEPKKETEKERRDRMNKMTPMELFSQLPQELKEPIGLTALEMKERDRKLKAQKPTATNIVNEARYMDDYYEIEEIVIENIWQSLSFEGYDWTTKTEKQLERKQEQVNKEAEKFILQQIRRLVKEFLKGKKFKTAKEGATAFWKQDNIKSKILD